ncbi:glycosyltransferase family 2 protein [archaeon]|nr:glycosyltransferase family 2 protein [archaeon]
MIHIIISSYNEPKSTAQAVRKFLNQTPQINQEYEIIVSDPFPEVEKYIKEQFKDYPQIRYEWDPDEGKSYALNLILQKLYKEDKNDIIIMTDGDVFVSENAVKEILKHFQNPNIGVVCGRPVPMNKRDNMYGYWAHLLFYGAHKARKKRFLKQDFFECSGYLWGIRNGVINSFPTKVSEDAIVPPIFWDKGYKIAYAENAKVFVLNTSNFKDWMIQRKRNVKGHEILNKLFPNILINPPRRTKTFLNEINEGLFLALLYPTNLKELCWSIKLLFARLYLWLSGFCELHLKKQEYKDGWRENITESTRPLD